MATDSNGWSTVPVDVVDKISLIFKQRGNWRCVAPRLRLVNKHWRCAVDVPGIHVSMRRLPDFPLCRELNSICHQNRIASLRAFPQFGRVLELSSLTEGGLLTSLSALSIVQADNADKVLSTTLPRVASLRRLELLRCKITGVAMDDLSHLLRLTDLRLCEVGGNGREFVDYEKLASLHQLRHLSLVQCEGMCTCKFFTALTQLTSLALDSGETALHYLDHISHCVQLRSLYLFLTEMDCSEREFAFYMTQLTALTVFRRVTDLRFYPVQNIQTLAIRSFNSRVLEKGLRQHPVVWSGKPIKLEPLRGVFGLYDDFKFGIHMQLIKSLTSLDIGFDVKPGRLFKQLSSFSRLKELRMHLSPEPRFFQDETDGVVFPRVTLWTIDVEWQFAGQFAAKAMPRLESLGVSIALHRPKANFCFEQLALLPKLHTINVAAGVPVQDESFWTRFPEDLSRCAALEHVGWRKWRSTADDIPQDVANFLARRHIIVDDDYSIFLPSP